ncbi:hypothetical protein [Delftia phage PhiW-14]|uniref:Uncharacterized protein n=1 Tax=Delftia phage PhiW-14 TaxID=665032 RepID=C9DG65_BPW14|nr:hypothetical protein DP-phiW-14_gp095 [Delftia phage PhiW-14]ACV50116.1 hypothetical protein [Delftia phage PhiW-14]
MTHDGFTPRRVSTETIPQRPQHKITIDLKTREGVIAAMVAGEIAAISPDDAKAIASIIQGRAIQGMRGAMA